MRFFCDPIHLILFLSVFIAFCELTNGQASDRVDQLSRVLRSGDDETKRTALFELRNIASPEASRAALPALTDRSEIVRATAAGSVIFLENSEGVNALRPLLSDRMPFVRREAAYALGKIGNWSATEPLITALDRERDAEVRLAIIIALGNIGDIESMPILNNILRQRPREENEMIRRSAARSLGQIAMLIRTGTSYTVSPESFLPEKFKSLGDPTAILANRIDSDAEPTIRLLIQVLDDRNESNDTRREAAFALGVFGNALALPALERYISDADPYLAEIARETIIKIRAVERLRVRN
ncbi:HEAT repeat domain-containing protein [Leptolyngbya sp. 7M]|uniref:HEAT repeat domain-containing protein n=1 Tax=Leptolyngbya sp. 7M TaxID=2812896 RepID=UPI001B8B1794|nr:HEAT repeat domain-containing protein [Leptolyngbya sp. 7M]QYO66145.1 HEAT repeat domain-containing protein [Leptolyngbya sp. 7M]